MVVVEGGKSGLIGRFLTRFAHFFLWLFERECLEPMTEEEQSPDETPRRSWIGWFLERESLESIEEDDPGPARKSWVGWLIAPEALPKDEPLPSSSVKPSLLRWFFAREHLGAPEDSSF